MIEVSDEDIEEVMKEFGIKDKNEFEEWVKSDITEWLKVNAKCYVEDRGGEDG
jgi:hypothetical protein